MQFHLIKNPDYPVESFADDIDLLRSFEGPLSFVSSQMVGCILQIDYLIVKLGKIYSPETDLILLRFTYSILFLFQNRAFFEKKKGTKSILYKGK
jgi:hypothetical protein